MAELVISDSGSIRNPSEYDIDNALLRLFEKKSDFIILNVDKKSFIQATCQNGRFGIEYRIHESDLIRIRKTFTQTEAVFLFTSFLAGNILPVQSADSRSTLYQNDRHKQWSDQKNISKVNIINTLFRFNKILVPLQVALFFVVVVDLFVLEGNTQVYSATSMQSEIGGSRLDTGLRLIAPEYARTYFVINGRNGQNNIKITASRDFGKHVAYGKQFSVTQSRLFKLTNGLTVKTDESAIIIDFNNRYRHIFLILSVTLWGLVLSISGKYITVEDYDNRKYEYLIYDPSAMTIYGSAVFLFILCYQLFYLFS